MTENPMSCPSAQNHTALGPSLNLERGCWETFASCDYFNILIFQLPKYSKDFLLPHSLLSFKSSSLLGKRSLRKTSKRDIFLSSSSKKSISKLHCPRGADTGKRQLCWVCRRPFLRIPRTYSPLSHAGVSEFSLQMGLGWGQAEGWDGPRGWMLGCGWKNEVAISMLT